MKTILSRLFARPAAPRPAPRRGLRLEHLESRLTPSAGSLDPSFNLTGKASLGFNYGGGKNDSAAAVAVQADGMYVVAGFVERPNGDADFGIARFDPNGSL